MNDEGREKAKSKKASDAMMASEVFY